MKSDISRVGRVAFTRRTKMQDQYELVTCHEVGLQRTAKWVLGGEGCTGNYSDRLFNERNTYEHQYLCIR